MVENLDAKDALLEMAPPGFFSIVHFNAYPAVLIELRRARVRDVRAAITDAWRAVTASRVTKPRKRSGTKRRSS